MVWGRILPVFVCLMMGCACACATVVVNPGFENVDTSGDLIGWQVHTGLDTNRYGDPDYQQHFDMIIPGQAVGGHAGSRYCAGFPREGTWIDRIWEHVRGRDPEGKTVDGVTFGKAALTQTVTLDPGTYVFGARLRTADGSAFSGMFSLGYNMGDEADYANDTSTGIVWTTNNLAVKTSVDGTGGLRERGEWLRYETEPFAIDSRTPVTVWIRFNYTSNHDMHTRWQVDDAFIEPYLDQKEVHRATEVMPSEGSPLAFPQPGQLVADCADDDEKHLKEDNGSTIRGEIRYRLFQHARCTRGGASFTYEFPVDPEQDVVYLAFEHLGPYKLTVGGRTVLTDPDASEEKLYPKEYCFTDQALWRTGKLRVKFESAVSAKEFAVLWIEAGTTTRFRERLMHLEWDTVSVPWRIGLWDADSNEFRGNERVFVVGETDYATLNPRDMRIEWGMNPNPGHVYHLMLGYFRVEGDEATAYVNVGDDDVVEYVSKIKGHEVLNVDITDYLSNGRNVVSVQADAVDFVALVETLPGITDNRRLGIYVAGDDLGENISRVLHESMFWVLDLHNDDTGFIDASIPRGKWWGQYWPIDIAMAMRSILFWGHLDKAETTARFIAKHAWDGHETNRSGSSDNTAGAILATDMCEILLRRGLEPSLVADLWPRISEYCDQVCKEVDESPFGLIKGTNWENAGNLKQGPCYALSTNLLAFGMLMKASDAADEGSLPGDSSLWRTTADRIRNKVLTHLVFPEDVESPTGWVYPKGTWAYGILDDGSYMLEPLAGYLWAGRLGTSRYGFLDSDPEIRRLYDDTVEVALEQMGVRRGYISGYANTYDEVQTLFGTSAFSDRTDQMNEVIPHLARSLDYERNIGATIAELSRWVWGQPGWVEDTNLVGVAEFLDWARYITGVDDVLYDGAQLRLIPRLPTRWNECGVNDWLVQYLRNGKRAMTRLSFNYQLAGKVGTMKLKTDDPVSGMKVRLGPFPKGSQISSLTIDGRSIRGNTETSGDGDWVWVQLNSGNRWQTIRAETK